MDKRLAMRKYLDEVDLQEAKSLGGMQSANRTEPTSFLKHIDAERKSNLKNQALLTSSIIHF
jgi:hypothetical protein